MTLLLICRNKIKRYAVFFKAWFGADSPNPNFLKIFPKSSEKYPNSKFWRKYVWFMMELSKKYLNIVIMCKFFHLMHFYGHTLAQEPLPQGVMKFTILVDPSLVIIIIYLVFLIYALELRRISFKKYINFKLFTPKLPPLGVRVIKFTISCLLNLKMLHTKFA